MSCARGTTLTFFITYLSPLMSKVYLLVNLFEKPVHNAVRCFSCSIFSHFHWKTMLNILDVGLAIDPSSHPGGISYTIIF